MPTTAPIRERPSNEICDSPACRCLKDPALHLGGDHGAVRASPGEIVLRNITKTMSDSLEEEVQDSFHAYESLWKARTELLTSREPHAGQHVGRARGVRHRRPGHHPRHRGRVVVAGSPTSADFSW